MANYYIGVDLGGSSAKMGLFERNDSGDGTLIEKWAIPTRNENSGIHILPDIAESIADVLAGKNLGYADLGGIGIGVPGPVDSDGRLPHIANLGWGDAGCDVAGDLGELTGVPVSVGNDANVAALGEAWQGAAKGCSNVIMITLGTGVGGGIIIDGRIVGGFNGAGGEIGHMHIDDDIDVACGCGKRGCLEQFASASAIARMGNAPDAKTVFDGMNNGDELCTRAIDRAANYLGKAIAILTTVLDPEVIVIGGGVSAAGDVLVDRIREQYQRYCFRSTRNVRFELATLGNDAGIYGAAKLVLG